VAHRRSATRRHAHGHGSEEKGTTQRKARLRVGSRWVSDVVVAGLTKKATPGRRTWWCSASRAAPVSCPTRTLPSPRGDRSGSTRSRTASSSGTPAATWCTAPFFPHLHSPLLPRRRSQEMGKTPSGLVWRGWGLGVPFRVPVKAALGQSGGRGAPIGGDAGATTWPTTSGRPRSFSVTG
jgi:hypothetical protein